MTEYAIALDIGTSGLRAQAIDLETKETVGTAITQRHPIPGMNVIDHVNFAIKSGEDVANRLLINCANQLFSNLGIDLSKVKRIGVCGNTFQLSLFENIEIRDLAYAGENMLKDLGVVPPKRNGDIVNAKKMGINGVPDDCVVIIPPAVRHEIGADAIAMLLITGVYKSKEPVLVVDYGTNAEMALICGDGRIITGSAAAGPAMEGQEIERGMLAAPGAISDVDIQDDGWKCTVLDKSMIDGEGDTVNPLDGKLVKKGKLEAIGITGTGTVATLYDGIKSGLITPPAIHTPDGKIHLMNGIDISSHDVDEAGKAIGAMRAGFLTLLHEAGMWTGDVKTAYMSGASGLYVDAMKALGVGMVVPGAQHIIQFGNTSIELARRVAMGDVSMADLRAFAEKLKATHCMFATSETFKNLYSIEYSVWCTSMPMSMYDEMLEIYRLPPLGKPSENVTVDRRSMTDLPDTDKCPVKVIESGTFLSAPIEGCIYCRKCEKQCPEHALKIIKDEKTGKCSFRLDSARCAGTACRRCERACPKSVIHTDLGKPTA
jgi:methylamine methyltransferase corrinoid protein reductive activase